MIGKKVEEETVVTLNTVRGILEERKEQRELTYEQQLAYEHSKRFSALEKPKEEKLRKALSALGLSDKTITKIIDIMPKNALTIKQILASAESNTFPDEDITKMLAAIKESA